MGHGNQLHLPEMPSWLFDDQGVAEVEEDSAERWALTLGRLLHAGDDASLASRARSWPQAASMSRPRVARIVALTPARRSASLKPWTRARDGGLIELPSIGFIGIRLTWLRGWRTRVARRDACSRLS